MNTYTQIMYQIVFTSKNHEKTLTAENRQELYKYIWGILKNKNCHLYRIGGISDHLHIVTHLHPLVSLASIVKDIKVASAVYIKTNNLFPMFSGWQDHFMYKSMANCLMISDLLTDPEHININLNRYSYNLITLPVC
jgi:putative transposase